MGTTQDNISLFINGVKHEVGPEVSASTHLVDYIRDAAHLSGTKALCREGGCGACTVVATLPDPENPGTTKTCSVNACQQPVYACGGWSVETVEALGDRFDGYHEVQRALAGFYGTQCGFCSPGMVMAMYGQQQSRGVVTGGEVERALDGNLCRCTGYRPILDAFKSLATDASQGLKNRLLDIEECYKVKCPKTGKKCGGDCGRPRRAEQSREVSVNGVTWLYPTSLISCCQMLNETECRIVSGNTGQGVYKDEVPHHTYISLRGVPELYGVSASDSSLVLGANVSLNRAIEVFRATTSTPGFHHLAQLASHWQVVANVSIRNVGGIGGNLMLKHRHPAFPSDIFLTLLVSGAELGLADAELTGRNGEVTELGLEDLVWMGLEEFLGINMDKKVVVAVRLPALPSDTKILTYKITPRAVNAHAYVNAAFRIALDAQLTVTDRPTLLFGGINPAFIHAAQTEDFLAGRVLSDSGLASEAAAVLGSEVVPDNQPQDASPHYRTTLAQSLLYKAILTLLGNEALPEHRSGGPVLVRDLSRGSQHYDEPQDTLPLGKPMPKVEAITQVSGEATYTNDEPSLHNELHGAFIQATVGAADIANIDDTLALAHPGVVTVVTAKDIPGLNNFMAEGGPEVEEVFASTRVLYHGQALGLVIARDRDTAVEAAKLVTVQYANITTPVLTIKDALSTRSAVLDVNPTTGKREPLLLGDFEGSMKAAAHVLEGEVSVGQQSHFPLEPMAAVVRPCHDGFDVAVTSIWPAEAQASVAQVLGVHANTINVAVQRVGGSFGGKIDRCHLVSAAAAVGATKTRRPVRVAVDLHAHMTLFGGRDPFLCQYKVGFDDSGKFSGIEVNLVCDSGCSLNDTSSPISPAFISNVYFCPAWHITTSTVTTNTASNTYMRSPGILQALVTMESVVERVAQYLGQDPLLIRELNMARAGDPRPAIMPVQRNVFAEDILPQLKQSADYDQRKAQVDDFNKMNRWRKKGLAIMPMCFHLDVAPFRYGVLVSILAHDGTVAIAHGGIEMGQGINTKVTQIAAHILGVSDEQVKIKATSTTTNANSAHMGATVCSDIVCRGVVEACTNLRTRLDDVRAAQAKQGRDNLSWEQLVKLCIDLDVDISERVWTKMGEHPPAYDIYGGACVEVEVDVLTGQFLVNRADLIEDCGRSMNPYVDLGQVEGAFVQGLGFCTIEKTKYDANTGQRLSNGTWEYKIPTVADIPVDLRVTLLPNSSNSSGVLRAKAVGEPPLNLAFGVVLALRQAITSARTDKGNLDWFEIDTPLTVEAIHTLSLVDPEDFV